MTRGFSVRSSTRLFSIAKSLLSVYGGGLRGSLVELPELLPSGFLEHHACNSSMPIETGVGRVAIAFSKEVANLNYNIIKRKHALNSIPRVAMVEVQLGEPTFLYRGLQLGSTA